MENLRLAYKILTLLDKSMSVEELDDSALSAESFGVPEVQFNKVMAQLVNSNFVDGIEVYYTFDQRYPKIKLTMPMITLAGMEYLKENSAMKKIAEGAKTLASMVKIPPAL